MKICDQIFWHYSMNQNYIQEGIENSVNSGNACNHSFENLFICHQSIKTEIRCNGFNYTCCFVCM